MRMERDSLYSQMLLGCAPMRSGVSETLAALKGRCVMGVVTSARREHFQAAHQSSGLIEYFDFVLTAEDCRKTKPDPAPYLLALSRSGYTPEECLVIEDSERGLIAARTAGIRCWVIPTSLTCSCDFSGADKVLPSADAVIPALLGLGVAQPWGIRGHTLRPDREHS